MVLKIFAALAGLVKVRLAHTDIDSPVFRLHYRLTSSVLFIACALVAASEYIGDPIQCLIGTSAADKYINTYCWITSTFTINTTSKQGQIAGLGNHAGQSVTFHAYYQWVSFILFFQGCFFYLPHLVWKINEGKTVQSLLQGLNRNTIDSDGAEKRQSIITYMKLSRSRNGKYFITYYICEILNFINVITQILLLEDFFGGSFMTYGMEVLSSIIEESEDDPFGIVFPKQTKCEFRMVGRSGTVEKRQALCVLPQNILNEKVFVILWFWFIILSTITFIQLVWRLLVCLSPNIRVQILEQRGKIDVSQNLKTSIINLPLGDFFLLDILGRNLDATSVKEVIQGVILKDDINAYNKVGIPDDDDDPVSFKRRMEMEEGGLD